MTIDHYENFPVASWLMPAALRPAVRCLYAFARSADDIADEGDASPSERISALHAYEMQLQKIKNGEPTEQPLFQELSLHIREHGIPLNLFFDLLSAFKQDTQVQTYANFDDLLDYCRRSANPIGRMMLALFRAADEENLRCSDKICSALQLINFWQDVAIDFNKPRVYLPQDELHRFQIPSDRLEAMFQHPAWQEFMLFQIKRARAMMLEGAPLALRLPGRMGFELRLVVQGGLRILEKIEACRGDVLHARPTINRLDAPILFWRALMM